MLSKMFEDVKGIDAIDTSEMPVNRQRGDYCKTATLNTYYACIEIREYIFILVHLCCSFCSPSLNCIMNVCISLHGTVCLWRENFWRRIPHSLTPVLTREIWTISYSGKGNKYVKTFTSIGFEWHAIAFVSLFKCVFWINPFWCE